MAMEHLSRTLIHQLPLFFGLSPKQMKAFLTICKLNRRNASETVCEYGASSNTLFILIEGQLDIVGADGTVVATTTPVTTVGEMGSLAASRARPQLKHATIVSFSLSNITTLKA
jgi:signal-transduction protein with cAMP-binding, CBS, and nucleotidyltransferase domain